MATITNRDRVGKAFETLAEGLAPYVDKRMCRFHSAKEEWFQAWVQSGQNGVSPDSHINDPSVLLRIIADFWGQAFKQELSSNVRNAVFALRNRRNDWAHNNAFQFEDTYRVLDEVEQVLLGVDAPQSSSIAEEKSAYMAAKVAADTKKVAASGDGEGLVSGSVKGLRPWREVAQPHDDVAQGNYRKAEFAADLQAVHLGTGSSEYSDPGEFFRRTYLTTGLQTLLVGAAKRVSDIGGEPVVDLQTNFGGGKTHSMIALYHLFSGLPLAQFPEDLRQVLSAEKIESLPAVQRAVLVGTVIKPGQPVIKDDGTKVSTLWGELAWQLGGRAAYDLLALSDQNKTSPGDALDAVFAFVGPCLILIDEWVAYARQLVGDNNLPAGTFDTHFTFAQALTEAAKRNAGVLLVVSIPASEAIDDTVAEGTEIELGGYGGKEALLRLRNVIGRLETSWSPATAEESFEIVRRRLFKPLTPEMEAERDKTVQAFADYYHKQAAELPDEVKSPRYVERMRQAYPIHPEFFECLYDDWSTLEKFQRTRGVLRLMAAVINSLWEAGDQSPMIMPSSLPLDLSAVSTELLRHLEDRFKVVVDTDIEKDVGSKANDATSQMLDREFPNLGKYQATRRVARAIFFGAAPTLKSAHRGIDPAHIKLACALPGETIETYGDALKRLSDRASYLYVESNRYWFDTRQSVVRQAQEAAEELRSKRLGEVHAEIVTRLKAATRDRGDFAGVHVAPITTDEISDDDSMRLVVLRPDQPFIDKSNTSVARSVVEESMSHRGTGARQRRNMVVFLAAEHAALEHLEVSTSEFMAWNAIVDEAEARNLDRTQEKQAKEKRDNADSATNIRLAETYRWLIVPRQATDAGAPIEYIEHRLDGASGLAVRAGERLQKEGLLYMQYPPVLLRNLLEGVLATEWADGHVTVGRLWEIFTQYPYLPKLRDRSVLEHSVGNGPASIAWQQDGFAVATVFTDGRYGELLGGSHASSVNAGTLVVKPSVAVIQLAQDAIPTAPIDGQGPDGGSTSDGVEPGGGASPVNPPAAARQTVFHGAVSLDPVRAVKEFQQLAEEIFVNLQTDGELELIVEIRATSTDGFADGTVRTVTENSRVLKFNPGSGFESE